MSTKVEIPVDKNKIYHSEYEDNDVIEVNLKDHLDTLANQAINMDQGSVMLKLIIKTFNEYAEPEDMISAMTLILKNFFSQVEFDPGDIDKDILKLAQKTLKQMDF